MPLKLLLSSVLSSAELILNKALMLDPASKQKLANLHGKIFAINCTKPECSIIFTVLDEGFLLSSVITDEADAEISASADALLKLLLAKDKNSIIRNDDIQLKGDVSSIQELQAILFELDIDWEYQLSKGIGDIPTQAISDSLDILRNFISNSAKSLTTDIDEYIHEEKNIVPTIAELESFFQRIDQLRLRIDRTESRIGNLGRN
jgi:ubiquinone biosynthesis accessory factor UbiJ